MPTTGSDKKQHARQIPDLLVNIAHSNHSPSRSVSNLGYLL
jgi:hypothetical protein